MFRVSVGASTVYSSTVMNCINNSDDSDEQYGNMEMLMMLCEYNINVSVYFNGSIYMESVPYTCALQLIMISHIHFHWGNH